VGQSDSTERSSTKGLPSPRDLGVLVVSRTQRTTIKAAEENITRISLSLTYVYDGFGSEK